MNMKIPYISILVFLLLGLQTAKAQSNSTTNETEPVRPIVQFSGVILTNDSIPLFIPFAHLRVRGRYQGTMSDAEGFFTLAAMSGDTIDITSLGFQS